MFVGSWYQQRAALAGFVTLLLVGGCAGEEPADVTDLGVTTQKAHPCSVGVPTRQEVEVADGLDESSWPWQEEAGVLIQQLEPIAGDRLGAVWISWVPEPHVVIDLTEGPRLPEVHDVADASGIQVEILYTATLSRAELMAASDRMHSLIQDDIPGLMSSYGDVLNNRVVFEVASGDDGGATTCARMNELFAGEDLPYAFDVHDAAPASTVRTTVTFDEAHLIDATTLQLIVGSCNGNPEVSALEESETEIRIEVTSTVPAPGWGGDACLDGLDVELEAPLGERVVVDMTRGATVDVFDAPWMLDE